MRKFSVLAAVVLALAAASSVFAVTPATTPAPAAATAMPAAHHWTASFKGDGLRVRARLFAASNYRFGWVEVQVRGLKAGSKVEVVLADGTTATTILDVTKSVRSHHGVRSFLVRLDAKQAAALKAAVAVKNSVTLTVTSGSATATGAFAPARG